MKQLLLVFWWLALAATGRGQTPGAAAGARGRPFVLGVVDTLHSAELHEARVLNIYLPAGYQAADTATYPVIYLLDGSADEDFVHVAGLVQFATFPWVKLLPNSIVVGIANVDRRRDFTFPTTVAKDKQEFPTTGGSAPFIRFLANELQPFMARHYRAGRGSTLVGESLGGLLAVEILWKAPALFTDYVIVSPSLWWDRESLLAGPGPAAQGPGAGRAAVYIGVGREGKTMVGDARRLAKKLRAGPHDRRRVEYEYFGAENHATIFHQAVYNAFKWLGKSQAVSIK